MKIYQKTSFLSGTVNRLFLASNGVLVWLRLLPDNGLAVAGEK